MSKRIVKKRSRSKKAAKVVISIVLVLALVAGGVSLYVSNLFGRLHRQELNETNLNIYDDPDDIMWKYHNDVKIISCSAPMPARSHSRAVRMS